MTAPDCTHVLAFETLHPHRPPRCAICRVVLSTRDEDPGWEQILRARDRDGDAWQDRIWRWGLQEAPWHDHAGRRPRGDGRPISLEDWKERADLRLDAAIAANTERIRFLHDFVVAIAAVAPEQLGEREIRLLPGCVGEMRLVSFALLGWAATLLTNAIRRRGGDYDGIVRPQRIREAPFAGYRAAIAAAFLDEGALGGRGAGGLAGALPSGVEAKHGLRGGMQFGTVTCNPTRSGSSGARGEARVLSRLAAQQAVETARLGQQHVRVFDDEKGCYVHRPVHEGTHLLSPAHVELLRLCDVGEDRARARIENHSVVPAIDPVAVKQARQRVVALPGAPRSDHEAASMLRAARAAVVDQLAVFELIPPPQERPRLSDRDKNPFQTPE